MQSNTKRLAIVLILIMIALIIVEQFKGESNSTANKSEAISTAYADTSSAIDVSGNDPLSNDFKSEGRSVFVDYHMAGDKWPLREVYSGRIECIKGQYVVLRTRLGTYAINGTAKSASTENGWKKIDEIQIRGKNIGPILDAGLKLCN